LFFLRKAMPSAWNLASPFSTDFSSFCTNFILVSKFVRRKKGDTFQYTVPKAMDDFIHRFWDSVSWFQSLEHGRQADSQRN
jgi:hypothetical protein